MKLNSDLGEGEPIARTRALLRLVDLANIACGGHAGDVATMRRAILLALENDVAIGAHPGFSTREDFGRGGAEITPAALSLLLVQQVGGFDALCRALDARLHHVKLHGALYHAVECSPRLARCYAEIVGEYFPRLIIVAFAGGNVLTAARKAGVRALAEVFAERGYRPDGSLVPRGEPGDVIADPHEVTRRLPGLRGETICVHADSPNAVKIARAIRRAIG